MNKLQKHPTEWKVSDTKDHMLNDSIGVKCPGKVNIEEIGCLVMEVELQI